MPITKTIQIKSESNLKKAIKYIIKESKTTLEQTNENADYNFDLILDSENKKSFRLVSSNDIYNIENADAEMKLVINQGRVLNSKSSKESKTPTLAHHVIQSFSPDDNLTPEQIHEIGRKTALELTGGSYQFVIATHVDKGHIHNHIIFNNTDARTFKKFRWVKSTASQLRKISDKHADKLGAKILDDSKLNNSYTKYSAYMRKNNFRYDVKERLDFLLKHSISIDDFIDKAKKLGLEIDFSGKYVTYKLLDKEQKRNIRDRSLSKKGKYSLDSIKEVVSKNQPTFSLAEINNEYKKFKNAKDENFELKVKVEKWQVDSESKNGIYLDVDFGFKNKGQILIPSRQVDKLENGDYNIFLKKDDIYYFMNEKNNDNNRYMKGITLSKQLSKDNSSLVYSKNKNISKLDNLISEFEFLSSKNISNGQQFENLISEFDNQIIETENELDKLDNKLTQLNIIISSLDEVQNSTSIENTTTAINILEENNVDRNSNINSMKRLKNEVEIEYNALDNSFRTIYNSYKESQKIKENTETRKANRQNLR